MSKKSKNNKNKKTGSNILKSTVKEDIQVQFHYQVGHSVIVKKGVKDPDYDIEIGGWEGKIYDIENEDSADPLLSIEWDCETQRKISISIIKSCKKDSLDFTKKNLKASEVEPLILTDEKDKNKIILTTMTKEIYMLARIHYDLFDREKVQNIFSKLRCMQYDNIQDRWVWLYEAEAKKIKFKGSYHEIPKERRPIILGSFYLKNKEKMYLNVNSFDRAKKAVVFFDKFFPRTAAKVLDIIILNKIFDFFDGNIPKHEDYFNQESIGIKDTEKIINRLKNTTSSMENPVEKLTAALTLLENDCKQTLPEVERFPIHFYEDGITGLDGSLVMRETIALQHWKGNKDYSFYDLMQRIIPRMSS